MKLGSEKLYGGRILGLNYRVVNLWKTGTRANSSNKR